MRMKVPSTRTVRALFWTVPLLLCCVWSAPARAADNCNSSIVINAAGVTTLDRDYEATSGTQPCIRMLYNGSTLDLNGHSITGISTPSTTAISCEHDNITITDSSSPKGGVFGTWGIGIRDCENIDGVLLDHSNQAIKNDTRPLDLLTDSVIYAAKGFNGLLERRSSTIENNIIHAGASNPTAIEITGMSDTSGFGKAEVLRNVLSGGMTCAPSLVNVHDNIFMSGQPEFTAPQSSRLLCQQDNALCEGVLPPMSFPLF
jgi:hypothetical protein